MKKPKLPRFALSKYDPNNKVEIIPPIRERPPKYNVRMPSNFDRSYYESRYANVYEVGERITIEAKVRGARDASSRVYTRAYADEMLLLLDEELMRKMSMRGGVTVTEDLTNEEAFSLAASWGGPEDGACFYNFNEKFRVADDVHRKACFDWLDKCVAAVKEAPDEYPPNELDQLKRLGTKLLHAPTQQRVVEAWEDMRKAINSMDAVREEECMKALKSLGEVL